MINRREFLWMMAGSLLVPYIPKVFYSIPAPVADILTFTRTFEADPAKMFFLDRAGVWELCSGDNPPKGPTLLGRAQTWEIVT